MYLLQTRCLQDQDVLQGAMSILEEEITPWNDPSEASTGYRKQLTKSLLYKVTYKIKPNQVYYIHISLSVLTFCKNRF